MYVIYYSFGDTDIAHADIVVIYFLKFVQFYKITTK